MSRKLYSVALYLLSPIIWLYFFYRGVRSADYFGHLGERLGFVYPSPSLTGEKSSSTIHIHCASVGETKAAAPLINGLIEKFNVHSLLITSTSPTGRAEVAKLVNSFEPAKQSRVNHCYLPIDWSGSVARFVKRINPCLSIILETELWPNLLYHLSKNNIPTLLANARMSTTSMQKYQKHPKLTQFIFESLTSIAAQFESDKRAFEKLGVPNKKISVVGSIKFDIQLSDDLKNERHALKQQWANNRPVWAALSIHPGEYDAIIDTHLNLLKQFPELLLIAIPRHPEKFDELKQRLSEAQITFVCRSKMQSPELDHSVIVGDTMGELMLLAGVADVAFVGGSLIKRGGHNPLEPAAWDMPVIMGSSVYNFSDVADLLVKNKALTLVNNHNELIARLAQVFDGVNVKPLIASNAKDAKNTGTENYPENSDNQKLFEKHGGSVERQIRIVSELLSR